MEAVSVAAQDDSSGANPSSVKSDDSSPRHESGRGSPPPNCAICLGTCRNKSFTDSCLHQFCFKCLLTWSRVKAECPLCKQNFRSIIHNVRSNHQYEEYMVEQRQTEETIERLDFDNLSASTRRFRYRTTLTLPRHETIAIQQLLLRHYPIMADVFPPPARAPPARRRSSAAFRRTVYRHNLWARPLPDFTGRFRDCSPMFYRYNTSQMHRLVPWLNRELHYLLNENIGHISCVIARILELLPQYHITSTEFREAIQVYFRDRTEHFLHELHCFASTPYDMTGYDRNVQYTTDTRISTMVNEVISSSESEASVDSDIVMVSSSGPAEPPPGPSRLPAPVYPQNYIPVPPQNNVIPIETISHSDTDDDSSEVMVVGYIKPPQDRTPEVVDLLGSDSDVIVQDTTPPTTPQAQSSDNQETRPVPLVKLILKRHAMQENADSDSEDSTYRPPPTRRKKRQRSNSTATTSDTCRTTPSPTPNYEPHKSESSYKSSSSSYHTVVTSSPSPSSFSHSTSSKSMSHSSSESSNSRKRKVSKKKKYKRKYKDTDSSSSDRKKSKKRKSRSHHRDNKDDEVEKDRNSKRKSASGKGVKSSKKKESSSTPEEQAISNPDQPSTSSSSSYRHKSNENRKRRRPSRESKRLKSVVNVMYNQKPGEASGNSLLNQCNAATNSSSSDNIMSPNIQPTPSFNTEVPSTSQQATHFDSEDDLPLNLSVNMSTSL